MSNILDLESNITITESTTTETTTTNTTINENNSITDTIIIDSTINQNTSNETSTIIEESNNIENQTNEDIKSNETTASTIEEKYNDAKVELKNIFDTIDENELIERISQWKNLDEDTVRRAINFEYKEPEYEEFES